MAFELFLTNELQKQHLNLSDYAWSIIDNDMYMFYSDTGKPQLSTFLNTIFINYFEISPSNLTNMVDKKTNEYYNILSTQTEKQLPNNTIQAIIEALISSYKRELSEQFLSFPKGEGRKFRVNNEVFSMLSNIPNDSVDFVIYNKPGKLLKALFETYSRLTFTEREQIIFADSVTYVKNAISIGLSLNLTLLNGLSYELIPYKIITDVGSNFNYIVGYARDISSDQYKYASFRLSRISKAKINYNKKCQLSELQKKEISAKISEKGVQFLLNDILVSQIRLSEEGIKKYNSQLHLRPKYIGKSANNIYEFCTTKEQLLFYFLKFGQDAEILSPIQLRKEFASQYKSALDLYYDSNIG